MAPRLLSSSLDPFNTSRRALLILHGRTWETSAAVNCSTHPPTTSTPSYYLARALSRIREDNRNHPDWNKIAEFLDDVARRMRQEGHDPKKKYALMGADDAVHDEALCGHN
uniref:Uncharacterized protein n=1 Tax=Zea mays TaxID=4577 RepID=A0A804UBJ9_MAIZE